MGGFISSRGGKTTMFQGTKKKYVKFRETEYSLSTSTADTEGYFAIYNDKGFEQPFQIVMSTPGKMMVLGVHESDGDEGYLYFSTGENSFIARRVYYVAGNATNEFYVTY